MIKASRAGTSAATLVALALLLGPAGPAWAQDDAGSSWTDTIGQLFAQPDIGVYFNRFFIMAVASGIGFGLGALFSPLFAPFRRIVFRVSVIIGVGAVVLYAFLGAPPWADIVDGLVSLLLGAGGLIVGATLGSKPEAARTPRRPTSYGSAKWATFPYLAERGLLSPGGFLLGEFPTRSGRYLLRYAGARHLLTVAPTRSGKGVASIIPNLLLHEGSALVIDPKGENALITAARRGAGDDRRGIPGLGQQVVLLDPWNIACPKLGLSAGRFNPLDWIVADDPDAAENAFLLADAIVIKEGAGESAFWDEEAKSLLTGIILYVATTPEEAGQRHLGRVRDILTLDEDSLKATMLKMFNHPHPMVSSTAARTAGKDPKLRSSVMASAQAHTHFLDSPRIRASLEGSDFSFADMKSQSLTVYLILPADRLSTFNRWLRVLIQQAITVNARNIDQKPARPILFMLDEMPTLGRLPSVEQAFGLMAGFSMQLWGIVQDLSQLAHIYGETGWQTFISNSGVIQYFGSRDKMTAEYFSTLCGVTTIEVESLSTALSKAFSFGHSFGGGHSGSSSTNSESSSWTRTTANNEAQRQLAYPDELMVLHGNQQVVFVENHDPIMADKVLWYQNADLLTLGVNLQPEPPPIPPPAQKNAHPPFVPTDWRQEEEEEPSFAGAPAATHPFATTGQPPMQVNVTFGNVPAKNPRRRS